VQAVNDLVAIGAATILLNQGIKIPEDLSIIGFGNVLMSEYFRVPLTTVRQPKFRLGVAATNSMLKLLRGERPVSKRLPAEIVVSTCKRVLLGRFPFAKQPDPYSYEFLYSCRT